MQTVGNNIFLTYTIRREPVEVGLNRGKAFQVHQSLPSNETILRGPMLKRYNNSQDDSLQENMVQLAR